MISADDITKLLKAYAPIHEPGDVTIGVLGGHSALDVCHGAKRLGFRTIAVCQRGRSETYSRYFKTRDATNRTGESIGCVDEVITVGTFGDVVLPTVQEQLRKRNTIFIHNRYFWAYCDFAKVEREFMVPIFGTRGLVRLEERDQPHNQYFLLEQAGIRIPKMFKKPSEIDRLALVKVSEAARGYERAFFTVRDGSEYSAKADELLEKKVITKEALEKAVIEEFVIGAPVNLNFFYSPFAGEVELLGTDTRRQTNLDGLLRLPAWTQIDMQKKVELKLIETGHLAVTVKESLIEKVFAIGEAFVKATQKHAGPGIIGPFALQGAVTAEEGREDIVIFDVSMRIPGSPGTRFTPYTGYLYGKEISVGQRIAMEIAEGIKQGKLAEILT